MSVEQSVGSVAGRTKELGEIVPQCNYVHHKSHSAWQGNEHIWNHISQKAKAASEENTEENNVLEPCEFLTNAQAISSADKCLTTDHQILYKA
jgi:hypothetical protein